MKRTQTTGNIGYSRYSLKKNTNNWRSFFVLTKDKEIYDMMTDLCSVETIDEEISKYVKRYDFNYVETDQVKKLHSIYFPLREEGKVVTFNVVEILLEEELTASNTYEEAKEILKEFGKGHGIVKEIHDPVKLISEYEILEIKKED